MQVLIKDKSQVKLTRLNESVSTENPKYKFSGVFTPCSYPGHVLKNRNNRIYQEAEVLKHIGYLRDKIKNDGCILGELDHPEGRFEVFLKEASHKITDLWWDPKIHCVMGTLELLPTPNGKIAKELVESGYPLYVSSRSAGDVDKNTDEVIIYQIFTYDLVCTPGFSEARLDRINESFNPDTVRYINESAGSSKKYKNLSSNLNLNENTEVYRLDEEVELNSDIKKYMADNTINLKDLSTPILEGEESKDSDKKSKDKPKISVKRKEKKQEDKPKPGEASKPEQLTDENINNIPGLEFRDMSAAGNQKKNEDTDTDYANHLNDSDGSDAEKKRNLVVDIKVKEADKETEEDKKDEKDSSDEKKDDIVKITANNSSDNDSDEEKKNIDKEETEEAEESEESEESDNDEKKAEEAENKFKNKADQVEKKIDKKVDKYRDLLNSIEAKSKVKESIFARWPFSVSLSESNFSKFCQLNADDRSKCAAFIFENQIYDIEQINEMFMTPLHMEKASQKNWLRLADQEYIDLYVKAPKAIQEAIEQSAKLLILENKADVDEFWRRTGIMESEMARQEQIRWNEQYKNMMNPSDEDNVNGYSKEFINVVEEWMRSE